MGKDSYFPINISKTLSQYTAIFNNLLVISKVNREDKCWSGIQDTV